ncbi:MAG: hypothetical protein PHV32_13440 [Eubacteriales bacterium]|nr:hypothetical protein [Eubacteriales bacterium]
MASEEKVQELINLIKGGKRVEIEGIQVHWWIGTVKERTMLSQKLNQWAKDHGINHRFPVPMPSRIKEK